MAELLGIISPLRKFLSDSNETIKVEANGSINNILTLQKDREYIIPDFQREIRWDKYNLSQLIDDIKSGPKYLGNVILTHIVNDNKFLIIDGQQRITVLTMILSCINNLHAGKIDTIIPCNLIIESFSGFSKILENNFPDIASIDKKILLSDKLHQINSYYMLWEQILNTDCITNEYDVESFVEKLGESNINIILNRSDNPKYGIRYFIDVNLKGRQLDTEDIFKAYLFQKDSGDEIREEWYKLKTNAAVIKDIKIKYPLLKLLEHYFFCDLYNNTKFKSLVFDEEFLLRNEFRTHETSSVKYRMRTHLVEVINNNTYMLNSLRQLNKIIEIMINIVKNDAINDDFIGMFRCSPKNNKTVRMDSDELRVIYNFMKKMLKDEKVLPKALVMKYILTVLLNNETKSKAEYRKIYGVYLLTVLFIIFENKKSKDLLMNVLKASNKDWYEEAIEQINSYFSIERITDNKIIAQFKKALNEDEEDYKFRCKSLATIYNFFKIKDNEIITVGKLNDIKRFVTDDESFTTEHFIISDSKERKIKVAFDNMNIDYTINPDIFMKYRNNLFNFIFVSNKLNKRLDNYWLPKKMQLINQKNIECDYSKMVINNLKKISKKMSEGINETNFRDKLDLFLSRDFKEHYIEYARNVLNAVLVKIKT